LGTTNSRRELTIKYPFDRIDAPSLVKYLFLVHEKKGLKPQRKFVTYLREMKKFLEEVGEERTIALVLKASEVCSFPFSIEFLKRLNEKFDE